MTDETKKTGGAFWMLIIVGMKSSLLTLSSLNDVQSDDQVLLRALAFIAAISAFVCARLLWKRDRRVRFAVVIPFLFLIGLLVALAFVGGEEMTPGVSIIGGFVVLFVGAIVMIKINKQFTVAVNEVLE